MSQVQRTRVTGGMIVWDKFDQIFYVAKGGSDANDGKNLQTPKLTIGSALTAAAAETPGAASRFAIVCLDDGIYTENITCLQYVDIYAPNATIIGEITTNSDCSIKFREQQVADANFGVDIADDINLNIDIDIISCAGSGTWMRIVDIGAGSNVRVKWQSLTVENGYGIRFFALATTRVNVDGEKIIITGTAPGILINNGILTGKIGDILGSTNVLCDGLSINGGEAAIFVTRIEDCGTAIEAQGGKSYIYVNYITGCSTNYYVDADAELYLSVLDIDGGVPSVIAGSTFKMIDIDSEYATTGSEFRLRTALQSTNSPSLTFLGDTAGTELEGGIYLAQAADPYLRVSVDDDAATPTLTSVLDIYDDALLFPNDNTVDIGASGATRPKDYYGAGNVTAAGTGTFLDVVVTSQTQNAVTVYGAGGELTEVGPLTDGQLLVGSTGNAPVAATLTAPAAGITVTGGAGTISFALADDLAAIEGLATTGVVSRTAADTWATSSITQHAVLIGGATQAITEVGPLTNGQLVIGSTGNAPVAATLTAGANITITEGAGTITIAAAAGGGGVVSWVEVTGTSQSAAVDTGYITNNAALVTVTLPATIAVGEVVRISGKGAGGWRVGLNNGQTIYFGSSTSTTGVGGRLDSTHQRDAVELLCVTANTDFNVLSSIGNITVT